MSDKALAFLSLEIRAHEPHPHSKEDPKGQYRNATGTGSHSQGRSREGPVAMGWFVVGLDYEQGKAPSVET